MTKAKTQPLAQPANVVREYGPFARAERVGGVTFDGQSAWLAAGTHLQSFDLATGEPQRELPIAADAGTAYDGRHLYQITADRIQKIDPKSGKVVSTLPAPGQGRDSGLTWAEGSLWVGQYRDRKIVQIDPADGKVMRTVESDRFVTGVTWAEGDLWHATLEEGVSELRRIDPESGEVLERLALPDGVLVSGLESDGGDLFLCGGASSGKVRAVGRPKRKRSQE